MNPACLLKKRKRGFTLIELLVVISIIAILSVIGVATYNGVTISARDARRRADLDAISKALEIYKLQNGNYVIATASFPCTSGNLFSWTFNNPAWGVTGTQTGCPSSLRNGFASYFTGGSIAQDPLCSGIGCQSSQPDYNLSVPGDGSTFTLYAKLEKTPPNPCNVGSYNYCLKSQQ